MKHMNDKFNRIQDPDGKIPEGEPVFLLRAQDKTASATLLYWALLQKNDQKALEATWWALKMAQWPTQKEAD